MILTRCRHSSIEGQFMNISDADADAGVDGGRSWAINGRFLTQRMTGVQRYAHEIVAALDEIVSQEDQIARQLAMRLLLPPGVEVKPFLSRIRIYQTRFGSGH